MVITMNTGIYVRVSTDEQALNGFSIRAQIDKLKMFCQIKEWKIYDVYSDEGISGKTICERPQLLRLINDIKSNKVQNVLVYKIDRLTRSTKDLIEMIDLFNKYDCSFNSLTENIDTKSSTGRMFIKIIGIFAEFERENIVERVRLGLERKVREGYTIACNNISYGYQKKIGEKVQSINQFEAYIVKKIFRLFLYGYNYSYISSYFNKYLRTNTKKFSSKTIKLILTNPNYVGFVRYGVGKNNYFVTKGKHLPIIDKDSFDSVQNIINKKNIMDDRIYCRCGRKISIKRYWYFLKKNKKIKKGFKYYCSNCKMCICQNKFDNLMSNEIMEWKTMTYLEKKNALINMQKIIINLH